MERAGATVAVAFGLHAAIRQLEGWGCCEAGRYSRPRSVQICTLMPQ
jgi:hypothetical protein